MDLSVCIVNWNTGELLAQCVNSVIQSTHAIDYEIIVVDNASNDDSFMPIVAKAAVDKRITTVQLHENIGFAAGNNIAIAQSRGRYLVALNPDTLVTNGALDEGVRFLDSHLECGAMGPRLLNPDRSLQPSVGNFPTAWRMFWEATRLRKLFPGIALFSSFKRFDLDYSRLQEVDQPSGACLFLRKTAIDEVGVFDERFFMYYEEVDLCYRIKKKGWRIFYNPNLSIVHFGGLSSQQNLDVRVVEYARSELRYFAKHAGRVTGLGSQLWTVRLLMLLEFAMRSAGAYLLHLLGKEDAARAKILLKKYKEVLKLCLRPAQILEN
jgi:GT2 family glycosyltransferase